jgi:hypothetical protein
MREFSTIAVAALSTGLATAIFNQGISWWREHTLEMRATGKEARYLAIRLAVILERFALDCADGIAGQKMYNRHGPEVGRAHGALPDLAPYPDESEWKSLEPDFLARALTLRNELVLADRAIGFWADVEPECVPGTCDEECGKCGFFAWTLAANLRRHYRFSPFAPDKTSWSIVDTLKREHDSAMKKARERATRSEVLTA